MYVHLIEGGVCCADDDLNGGDEEINQPTAEPRKLGLPRVDIHLIMVHDDVDDDHDDHDIRVLQRTKFGPWRILAIRAKTVMTV